MKAKIAVAVMMAAVLALGAWSSLPRPRVYSTTEVSAGLQHDPRRWVGRTVLVRGTLIDFNAFNSNVPNLTHDTEPYVTLVPPMPSQPSNDPVTDDLSSAAKRYPRGIAVSFAYITSQALTLRPANTMQPVDASTFLSFLQKLPLINRLFPAPDGPMFFRTSIYRVHLLAPNGSCVRVTGQRLCYDGILTDGVP